MDGLPPTKENKMKKYILVLICLCLVGCFPTPPHPKAVVQEENTISLFETEELRNLYPSQVSEIARQQTQFHWELNGLPENNCLDDVAVYFMTNDTFSSYAVVETDWGVTIDWRAIEINGTKYYSLFIAERALREGNEIDLIVLISHELLHYASYCEGEHRSGHHNDRYNFNLWADYDHIDDSSIEGQIICNMNGC